MYPDTVTTVSNRKGERGSVLAYTVMSAFFLFLAVGLCVDLSHLYLAKTELQNSADAAALAGASEREQVQLQQQNLRRRQRHQHHVGGVRQEPEWNLQDSQHDDAPGKS
jgi:uncharacterized membrane protein